MHDLAIIGGGPGGYTTAVAAAQKGLSTILFEMDEVGGVCLNRGCIPTKTILKSAEVYQIFKNSLQYGIKVDGCILEFETVINRKIDIVRTLISGVHGLLKANKVDFVHAQADIAEPGCIYADGKKYLVKNTIIATGSQPIIPAIPGIDRTNILTSNELLELSKLPKDLIIIGGGVIGLEFAFAFSRFGCHVTIVEMLDKIIARADDDVIDAAWNIMVNSGVQIICEAKVKKFSPNGLVYEKGKMEVELSAEKILVATGRKPNVDMTMLNRLGISNNMGKIITNEYLCTNIPHIYAIGDVNGKSMLAHTAMEEGKIALQHILGGNQKMRYDRIPQCIYSTPEIAWIGITERQAIQTGTAYKVIKIPMLANGKSIVDGEYNGFIKLISDMKTKELLGAHLVCLHATDIISEISLALTLEATSWEIAAAIHPHPTISEALSEAAYQLSN